MSDLNHREQGPDSQDESRGYATGKFIDLEPLATYYPDGKKIDKPAEPLYPDGTPIAKPKNDLELPQTAEKFEEIKPFESNREEDLEKAKYRLELAQNKSQIQEIVKEFNEPVAQELDVIGRGVNLERFMITSVQEGEFVIMKNITTGKKGRMEELEFWELPAYKVGDTVKVQRSNPPVIEDGWHITEIHDIGPNQPRREIIVVKVENGVPMKKKVSAKKLFETNL